MSPSRAPLLYTLALLALCAAGARAGTIIECRAADGSVTFADTRCPAGQSQQSKKSYRQRPLDARGDLKNLENGSEYPAGEDGPTDQARHLFMARFVDALSATQALRMSLIQHYMIYGEWPGTFEDLGLSGKAMTSSTIAQSRLLDDGRLLISLVESFGEGKQIVLAPAEVMSGTRIEWRCYSNFPAAWLASPLGQPLCESRYF